MTSPDRIDTVALAAEIARRIGVRADRDAPLAKLTTMRVGGPADLLATAHNGFELRGLIRFARARGLPLFVLGRGSNVIVSDRGVRGLVVHVRAEGSRVDGDRYVAAAGVPMARAATETQKAGLSGLEFGLAIPGTIGGAVWANAGAHGSDVAAVIESADVLLTDGSEARVPAAELGLGYRDSRFKRQLDPAGREIILGATFRLTPAPSAAIRERLDDIRRWRQAHQPLGLPSAGSVFRNPDDGPAAGLLIDRAGLKGFAIGGASVSAKHANFIIADRTATAADVRRLADHLHATIRATDGLDLAFEVEFIGDWTGWPWPADDGRGPASG
ncbi:MAG TPA: UDP-N-acetylmuramate dehydrogenase [Candidatus Sulfomarinibacteraceae bacterium]|nr:UDP-N-acetylmuramate dehydrogenase [Candidatus Sulfomarinibacteraceae bacterium]